MASIHKNKRSPYWQAAFTLSDGTRAQKSTGTRDRKKALQIAIEFEKASDLGRRGMLTDQKARDAIASIYAVANQDIMPTDTVKKYLARWLRVKAIETKDSSLAAYTKVAERLEEFLGPKSKRPLDAVTVKDATGFRDSVANKLAASSANKHLKIARVIWNDAMRDSAASENPFARVKVLKAGPSSRHGFSVEQVAAIYEKAPLSWRGMILLGYYTGQRIGDLSRLTWQNLQLTPGKESLNFVTAKTGRPMVLPIAKPLLEYFLSLPAPDDPEAPLFPELHGLVTETLSGQFSALVAEAGFGTYDKTKKGTGKGRDGKRKTGKLSFHSLRHTTTSALKSAGVSNAIAQEIVGHDSEAVSRHYTKIETTSLRKAVNKLPNITGALK